MQTLPSVNIGWKEEVRKYEDGSVLVDCVEIVILKNISNRDCYNIDIIPSNK